MTSIALEYNDNGFELLSNSELEIVSGGHPVLLAARCATSSVCRGVVRGAIAATAAYIGFELVT